MNNPYREALVFLWDGRGVQKWGEREEFICICLDMAEATNRITSDQCIVAKQVISKGLQGFHTYQGWISSNFKIIWSNKKHQVNAQDARRRWLLWLADLWDQKYIQS